MNSSTFRNVVFTVAVTPWQGKNAPHSMVLWNLPMFSEEKMCLFRFSGLPKSFFGKNDIIY